MRENLGGLAQIPQWFVWFLQWEPDKAKFKKLPFNPAGSGTIDHLQPANWLTYDSCNDAVVRLRAATPKDASYTWTHGFLFTEDCGYWFFDADNAIADGAFTNELHPWLLENMPGAAFEWSSSGRGYHLFGKGELPPHACKVPKAVYQGDARLKDFELYTADRGVAFGLNGQMTGCADSDHTAFMAGTVIPAMFPKSHEDTSSDIDPKDYRDAPQDERWVGPEDDEDLIRRAMSSQNVADKLGNGTGLFAALWTNDTAQLAAKYPGDSEKDMALIAQLAFWTGKNPARIERLMKLSGLVREKWSERRANLTWLQYSILEQLKKPMNVLQDKRVEDPIAQVNDSDSRVLLGRDDQAVWFKDCVYVLDEDAIYTPIRSGVSRLLNEKRFSAMRGGKVFIMDQENMNVTKKPWDAFLNSQVFNPPKVETTCFRPELSPGAIATDPASNETSVNVWQPPVIRSIQGDVSWFMALVVRLLPNERDQRILLSYMASMVRNPGKKFRWCPVLQGTKGNGKSSVMDVLSECVGRAYTTFPTTKQLTGKFNDWQVNRLLAVVNDVSIDSRMGSNVIEQLRPMITDVYANLEGKGKSIVTKKTCLNYAMTMNRFDGIPKDDDERRFAIFFTPQQCKEDVARDFPGTFFIDFNNWLQYDEGYAKCAWFLQNYQIDPEFDPAGKCQRAPETSTEEQVREANKSPVAQIITELEGEDVIGFRKGWISIAAVREELARRGNQRSPQEIRQLVAKMGYVPHPGLGKESRLTLPAMAEGNKKVMVWVKPDHYSLGYSAEGATYISRLYLNDNSFGVGQ